MSRGASQHLRQIHQQQQNETQKQKQQQGWAQQHAWHARGQQPKTHSRSHHQRHSCGVLNLRSINNWLKCIQKGAHSVTFFLMGTARFKQNKQTRPQRGYRDSARLLGDSCWPKKWGATFLDKKAEKSRRQTRNEQWGEWKHTDSWCWAQMCAFLKPNTNA